MKLSISCLALLLALPPAAQATTYKCKQPDGTTSYQETPCAAGSTGSAAAVKPVQSVSSGTPASGGTGTSHPNYRTADSRPSAQQKAMQRQVDEMAAREKAERCAHAQQQLGVARSGRPIYRQDVSGGRNYVDDKDRENETAAAEQRMNEACN